MVRISRDRGRPKVSLGYRRLLVPMTAGRHSEKALDIACKLAAERHASVTAVVVIEVPRILPLDAHMLEEEDEAHRLLDRAEAVGASYGVKVSPRIRRGREAATAIVDQASSIDAELVVVAGERKTGRSPRAPIFGSTIHNVLKKASCRVMLISSALPSSATAERRVSLSSQGAQAVCARRAAPPACTDAASVSSHRRARP